MSGNFELGKNAKYGYIDFSKLKSGLKAKDIIGNDEILKPIFDLIAGNDGVLDRDDINSLCKIISGLAEDNNLSAKESGRFTDSKGEKIGKKNSELLFRLLQNLAKTSEGIKSVETNNETEIVEYNDGTKEIQYKDGSKEVITKTGKIKYDSEGNKVLEEYTNNNTKTTVLYKDNKPIKTINENNEYKDEITYEDNNEIRVSTSKKDGSITKYVNDVKVSKQEQNTLHTYANGVQTSVTTEGPTTTTVVQDENGKKSEKKETKTHTGTYITETNYEGENSRQTTYINNKAVKQKVTIDGITYTANYDVDGNTKGVIVQNGESLNDLAKKFGCSVQDIINLNKAQIKWSGKTPYFLVGAEIIVPGKIAADHPELINRKTKEETINDYTQDEIQRQAARRAAAQEQAAQEQAQENKELEELGLINHNGEGDTITINGKNYTIVGEAIGGRKIVKDNNGAFVVISHDNIILKNDFVKQAVKKVKNSQVNSESEVKESKPTQSEINIQKESAKQIVQDLKKAISGLNDHELIKNILDRIDNPIEFEEVENLLKAEGYKTNDLYSSIESFINKELQRVASDFSCEELEKFVQKWIDNGILKGDAAIKAQARLAARVICDGGDGFGTDCDKIRKGIYMIKAPNGQGNEAAKKVYDEVNKIIANHNTFYGLGTKCKDLLDYLEGEIWDSEIKYLNGMLAETNALQGTEKAKAVQDLVKEAVSGAGTNIENLIQALKGINSREDRLAIEEKLKEYCEKKGIKPKIEGQSYLQAVLYDECDIFLGVKTDHKEIRKFNEMLIEQGVYNEEEIINLRAEQAVLQLLEKTTDEIKDAIQQIKDPKVLAKINELLKTKGYENLDNFLNKNFAQIGQDLMKAELASNNLLDNNTATEVAFRLLQNSDFDKRAMGLKAIRNENVAKAVDKKLQTIGSSLAKIYEQFNKEKAEYKEKAEFWNNFSFLTGGVIADYIGDKYAENTDVSDNIYVETNNTTNLTPEQQQAYETARADLERRLTDLKKAYQESLDSQGAVSDFVNRICESYNIGTTREEIQARIEHDTETLRLLDLAAKGKLGKIVDGKTVAVSFEEVFNERQLVKFDSAKTAEVAHHQEKVGALYSLNKIITSSWTNLENSINSNDSKRLTVAIYDTLKKLSQIADKKLSLESFGYSLNSEGVIVDSSGKPVEISKLKEIAQQLKKGLADCANASFGTSINEETSADSIKELLEEKYQAEVDSFKDKYKEAWGQEPPDELLNDYISTIETGKMVINIGAAIGAAIAAPFTMGGSLVAFLGVSATTGAAIATGIGIATVSMGLNSLEHSTDADGYTNSEWTADAEQAFWEGLAGGLGAKVGMIADSKIAPGAIKHAKAFCSKLFKNPSHVNKAATIIARLEAAGFEVASDSAQATVEMFAREGKLDSPAFWNAFVMSLIGNAAGHAYSAFGDIKADVDAPKPNNSQTPVLDKATSNGEAPSSSVHVGQKKAAEILEEVSNVAQKSNPKVDDIIKTENEVDAISDRTTRRKAQQDLKEAIEKLSPDDRAIYERLHYDGLQKKVGAIFDRHNELSTTDVRVISEYIQKTDDEALLAQLKEQLRNKELTYGGITSNYNTLNKAIDSKIELIKARPHVDNSQEQPAIGASNVNEPEFNQARNAGDSNAENVESTSRASRREKLKAEASRIRDVYGKKIARAYSAVLEGIATMKTVADFNKLATRIKEKFVEYKALADDLMVKLKAKAKDLKLKISETIDDIKAKSKTNNIDPQYRRTSDEFIPDELVRNAGNNGKPINENYIQASKDLREHYNQAIANGTYADSYENYVQTITQGHKVAYGGFDGKHAWYGEVGEGGIDVNPGRIRGEGSMSSNRVEMGQTVESIAKKYGDKYSTNEISKVKLAGIPDEACPMNLYTQHSYPDGKYMSAYFEQMQRTAKEALELIENGASQDKILAKLAEHYQYAANARPFGQINNSLFMNEINTLLQKAGMKPMPHGILDHVAQRLQPDAFKKYFIDEYKKTALDTPNNMRSSGSDNIGGANRHNKSQSMYKEATNSPQFMNKGISFKIDIDTKISLANGAYVLDFSEPSVRNKLNSLKEGESLLVGRTVAGQKDIKIANQYVSGQHLKITKTKDGFIVEDLGSKNGSSIYKTKSAYQNQGANKSQQHNMSNPIEQSRKFNRTHKVGCDEKVADGYKDGGRSARISDDGSVQSSREIIVVDRTRDIALQKMIQEVKAKTANMTPKQKAAFLQSYVHQKCGNGSIACQNLNAWEDNFRNREVLLGDIINTNPPVAVCRHRSLLSKILGDEIGLHIELQRGNFYNNNGQSGGHAWNVVKFEDGTSAIYDAMHNKTSNTTPGAVDDYAKQYYTTRNEDLYSNGASNYKTGKDYSSNNAHSAGNVDPNELQQIRTNINKAAENLDNMTSKASASNNTTFIDPSEYPNLSNEELVSEYNKLAENMEKSGSNENLHDYRKELEQIMEILNERKSGVFIINNRIQGFMTPKKPSLSQRIKDFFYE